MPNLFKSNQVKFPLNAFLSAAAFSYQMDALPTPKQQATMKCIQFVARAHCVASLSFLL